MARVLEPLRPLLALLGQADADAGLAGHLCEMALSGACGEAIRHELAAAVTDTGLAGDVLVHAGVLSQDGALTPIAAIRLGQAQALAEALADGRCELVLTVPAFLRDALHDLAKKNMADERPRETWSAIAEVASAARDRLVIAAPYLHPGFVAMLAPEVERIVRGGGEAIVLTRALSRTAPARSLPNHESITLLRAAARRAGRRLIVHSWEEEGLGVHLKAVVADRRLAYLGSANLTPQGAHGQAEAGVLLRGRQVALLAGWLDHVALALEYRLSPAG